jgi:two-component system OmpR family sensor kinase
LSRLPIRLKLTAAFAVAMAAVLAGAGVVLLSRFESQLDRTTEADLRLRARDVAGLVTESRRAGDPPAIDSSAGRLVQILDLRNRVVAASPELRDRSVLTPGELRVATTRELLRRRGPGDGVLLIARPAGRGRVAVVGTSLERRAEARSALAGGLLLAGPAILLLALPAGYGVAFFALRPVERMRRRAQAVTAGGSGQRLPVPPARDELAALGRTLNDMIARLERALHRERTLVADVSHELRTPLAIAQAEVELALTPATSREEMEDALRSVGEEVERLVRLCDDLLLVSRSDREELRLQRRRISVPELLEDAAQRARRAYGEALAVTTGATPGVYVEVDPLRLEQALSNLVANSSRYGASRVRIWSSVEDEESVRLHVSDDGPGFEESFLPRAFNRFARAAGASAGPGAGLGLAIVAAIARAHGGDAGARNVAPHGADVWLRVPLAEPAHAAASAGVSLSSGATS